MIETSFFTYVRGSGALSHAAEKPYVVLLPLCSFERIDQAISLCGKPFSQVWELALKDFHEITSQYNISPATLFCVYLEWLDMMGKSLS